MTFTAIPLTDLPASVVGAKSKPITPEDMATAEQIVEIVASGNAAGTYDVFDTRKKAETAARKCAALINKIAPPLADGLVYRFRTLALATDFSFAIVSGNAPKVRGPHAVKVVEVPEVSEVSEVPTTPEAPEA